MKKLIVGTVATLMIFGFMALPQAGRAQTTSAGDNTSALFAKIQELQNQINALKERLLGQSKNSAVPSVDAVIGGVVSGSATQVMPSVFAELRNQFDSDTSNDEIVQLNNLSIDSVIMVPTLLKDDGTWGSDFVGDGVIAVIAASRGSGAQCNKYENESDKTSRPMPCPLSPEILYNIGVTAKTHLFLRNRQPATLADMAVGDRINVYGFMDPDRHTLQALIVRNLDKPAVAKYIQLNNVEVVEGPLNKNLPTTIVVAQKSISPCLDFEKMGQGVAMPCPMGIKASDSQSAGGTSMPAIWPPKPFVQRYRVAIGQDTKVIDRNRNPLEVWSISVGDTLNIYGLWQPGADISVKAATVRDLSKPVVIGSSALQVAVTSANSSCWQPQSSAVGQSYPTRPITCGIIYNATVVLYNEKGEAVAKASTQTGAAVFLNLAAGGYTVAVEAPGYNPAKQSVTMSGNVDQALTIALKPISEPPGTTISVRSESRALTGVVGQDFLTAFIASGGDRPYKWAANEGELPPGLTLSQENIYCFTIPCPQPTERVALKGNPTKTGSYTFSLTAYDGNGRSGSGKFTVTINGEIPPTSVRCSPEFQQVASGQLVKVSASGGNGDFSWSAPGGAPEIGGNAAIFSTTHTRTDKSLLPESREITVTRGNQSASWCKVQVMPPVTI
ncbi:MAG: putative Ig domain-containing protein [Patescibacteria group bacterium]